MAVVHAPAPVQPSLWGYQRVQPRPIRSTSTDLDGTSAVLFEPGWLDGHDALFEELVERVSWKSMRRPMYDRVVDVPRLIANLETSALGPDDPLAIVAGGIEATLGLASERIGLNYYRDGSDSVAWHGDTLATSTQWPTMVALVSLGSPRQFKLRPRPIPGVRAAHRTRTWLLHGGDLLVMYGRCQHDWEHSVPKMGDAGPRISLAFRSAAPLGDPRLVPGEVPPLGARHKLQ